MADDKVIPESGYTLEERSPFRLFSKGETRPVTKKLKRIFASRPGARRNTENVAPGIDIDLGMLENRIAQQSNVRIFDNGGQTADRYTVIIGDSVFTMSENAMWPQGVNMYAGEVSELPGAMDGTEISLEEVPEEVKRAIDQRQKQAAKKFAQDVPEHGRLPQYQPFAALNELPWMADRYPNEQWKLIWIYDDAAFTSGEQYFATQEEAMQYLEEMVAEGLIRKTAEHKKLALEFLDEPMSDDECPACSGQGVPEGTYPGLYTCSQCGGIFGELPSWDAASKYIDIQDTLGVESSPEDLRYFDFFINGERTHGWYDRKTKRVVQWG